MPPGHARRSSPREPNADEPGAPANAYPANARPANAAPPCLSPASPDRMRRFGPGDWPGFDVTEGAGLDVLDR